MSMCQRRWGRVRIQEPAEPSITQTADPHKIRLPARTGQAESQPQCVHRGGRSARSRWTGASRGRGEAGGRGLSPSSAEEHSGPVGLVSRASTGEVQEWLLPISDEMAWRAACRLCHTDGRQILR